MDRCLKTLSGEHRLVYVSDGHGITEYFCTACSESVEQVEDSPYGR